MDLEDDRALYEAWLQDGTDAQEEAFAEIWHDLFRIAAAALRRYPDGEHLAEDCAQEAVMKILLRKHQCREPERFRGWTRTILRNVVRDTVARAEYRRRAPSPEDLAARPAPPVLLSPPVDLHALLSVVVERAGLSDRSLRAVRARYLDDLPRSDEQLAAEEGTSAPNIQVTRAKNLAKLRHDVGLLQRLRGMLGV